MSLPTPPAPAPALRTADVSRRWPWLLAGVSYAFTGLLVALNHSETGDLVRWYTDPLHHAHAAWVALHKGLAVYTQPFGVALQGVPFRHPEPAWPFMPGFVYPPGVLALFGPLALLGQWLPLTRSAWAHLLVLTMLALAHLAWVAVLRAQQATRAAGEWTLSVVAWLVLVRLGTSGFYDGAYLACGAMSVHALATRRPERALLWFSGAALLHYRAVVLAPVGAAALWACVGGRPWRTWPWRTLAWVALALVLCVGSFALTVPVTRAFRDAQLPLLAQPLGGRFLTVAALTLLAVGVSLWLADAVVAATALAGGVLAVVYVNFWWHAAVLLFAPLAVGAWRPGRNPVAARAVLVGWLLCLQPLAWRDHVPVFATDVADFFQPSGGRR